MRTRVNLTIDPKIAHRAKQYAKREKTSLSAMVERYLEMATRQDTSVSIRSEPFSQQWRGSMKLRQDDSDQRLKRLNQKYGS